MSTTIVIVEDESIVAQDLQFTLEDLGYEVPAIADSGELALALAKEINPDLMLMDIRIIGEIDGIETAKIIYHQFDIPVIFMTAHSDEETLARAKTATPFGYVIKPFEKRELRTIIEIALYKHQMEKRLKDNAEWLETVLRSIADGVIATDETGKVTFMNTVAENITGWLSQEAIGKPITDIFDIFNEITGKTVSNPVMRVLKTRQPEFLPENTTLRAKNGQEIPIEDSAAPVTKRKAINIIKDSKGHIAGAVLVFRDVTQQRLAARKLHRQAYYDDLTTLPNRAWFRERLTDALERMKRNDNYLFAILFLDLDRFKIINDSLGHTVGDRILSETAKRIEQAVRTIDTVARLGGDEFAILLENLQDASEAYRIANRINKSLSICFDIEEQEIFTSCSIGIVLSSSSYQYIEELIQDADIAMYRAKNKGKGRYEVFNAAMRQQIMATSQLENYLRRAIEKNEFEVHYQPIINLFNQKIIGFEALVRWNHPEKGMISPLEFIPIAEETGLIIEIDKWVCQQACHQMKSWHNKLSEESSLIISVNLSSKHLVKSNLVEEIYQILKETGLNPNCLKLEITETALIENPDLAAKTLNQLKNLGVSLSLDDFGTGYSSLSYLHTFPFNMLKIDRSFISGIDSYINGLEIIRIIVMLGQTLGMKVIAEGIETSEQLNLLKELQCEYGQGYFFSKPISAAEVDLNCS